MRSPLRITARGRLEERPLTDIERLTITLRTLRPSIFGIQTMRLRINNKGKLVEIKMPDYPFIDGYISWTPPPPTSTPWDSLHDLIIIERLP
jgi:hypothetical protein